MQHSATGNWPWYIGDAVEALPTASGEERTRLMRLIAANVGDEATLRAILGVDPEEFASFYPDMRPVEMNTTDTIDSFISRFSSEQKAETPEVEQLVVAPAIDYASLLERGEARGESQELETREKGDRKDKESKEDKEDKESKDDKGDDTLSAIDSFLAKVPPKKPTPKPAPDSQPPAPGSQLPVPDSQLQVPDSQLPSPGSSLSEGLARIMIKKGNYRKAMEIITELSLNNPKKSIYFADQMRFLQKLIANQEKLMKK